MRGFFFIYFQQPTLEPSPHAITFFEIKAFGWREKLRLNESTVKLERSVPVVEEDIPFAFKAAFHLIRVTMEGNVMKVYLDENPTPIAIGNSTDDDGSSRFEFGKAGSQDCGASIDWIAILNNGNYAPGEGPALPSDLFLSSDATLSDLQVNGQSLPDFSPNVFDYDIDLGETMEIPTVNFTTNSDLATVVVTNPIAVPNATTTLSITAQDGFTQNIYSINYIRTVSITDNLKAAGITIFPNPTKGEINIISEEIAIQNIQIFNQLGALVYENQADKLTVIATNSLKGGLYFMVLKNAEGQFFKKKIIIQ